MPTPPSGLRLLLAEGNPADANDALRSQGLMTNGGQYEAAVRLFAPDARVVTLNPADQDPTLPGGMSLAEFDGLIIGGSGLHVRAQGNEPAVARQVDLVRAALEAGVPVLGSCWGLQVGVVAAGGDVGKSPNGREVGVCRGIERAGDDPEELFLRGKPPVYQSLALHYDEVISLPSGARVLAANRHSDVQAAIFDYGRSCFWGVQYHPEFDFAHMSGLIRRYAPDMIDQGIFADADALDAYCRDLDEIGGPGNSGAAARLGLDSEVQEPRQRRREIENWLGFISTGIA